MWARGAGVVASASAAPSPLARAFQKEPRGTMGPARVRADLPFIDSDAAGRQEYDTGDFETALAEFKAQMERDPGDAAARSNAGQVLIRMGRTEEALPFLQEACDLDPSRWAYRFNLARAQGLLGRWASAVEDYGKAATLFPGDYATLFNFAQALHRAGREEEAVAQYRQAIDRKGDDATFYLALGISEEKLGHAAEAATAYRRFVTMDPSAKEAAAVTARARRLEATPAAATPVPAAEGAAPGASS
jgi:tetratricopeptide (TPR) repeat protein